MLAVIEQLLVVQDRDRKLIRLRAELGQIPIQRRLLEDKARHAETEFESVKGRALHAESDRKKLELDADALRQRKAKVESEQNSTRSNDQYQAYQHQLNTLDVEIGRLEDRQLECMETAESLVPEVRAAAARAVAEKEALAKAMADLDGRRNNLEKELEQVTLDRTQLAARVDAPVLARYERLLKTKGDNVVVGVNRSTCGGCHMKLPMQSYVEAQAARELVTCPNCGRILYHTPDMEAREAV